MSIKKPMLAATIKDVSKDVKFPCVASLKLDGIRAIVIDGVVLSRSMKPIPNKEIQAKFGRSKFNGLDGELIVGKPNEPDVFNKTTSQVMTIKGSADGVRFFVFDTIDNNLSRKNKLHQISCIAFMNPEIKTVHEEVCEDLTQLLDFEERALASGFEGVMIRSKDGYKQGRSTLKEGYLSKLKRFSSAEAIIIGFEELQNNLNEKMINEVGNTARSSSKAGKVDGNTLGSLLVKDASSGLEFNVGSGFTSEQRAEIWNNRDWYLGKIITYKFFEVGVVELPRFPVYLGVRHEDDMS
jgi:DNA ligase-1